MFSIDYKKYCFCYDGWAGEFCEINSNLSTTFVPTKPTTTKTSTSTTTTSTSMSTSTHKPTPRPNGTWTKVEHKYFSWSYKMTLAFLYKLWIKNFLRFKWLFWFNKKRLPSRQWWHDNSCYSTSFHNPGLSVWM